MENDKSNSGRLKQWVIIGILAVVVLFILLWAIILPLIEYVTLSTAESEIRLYLRLFLLLFAISVFGGLRLYNAIVANTRFSIKLRESIIKLAQEFPALERTLKSLITTHGTTKTSLHELSEALKDNVEMGQELLKELKKKQG